MPTNQEARQASVRAVTGTTRDYNGDWSALFDLSSIAVGDFNGRFLAWLNLKLSATYTSLPAAMQALAVANGAYNFSSLGTFDASTSVGPVTIGGIAVGTVGTGNYAGTTMVAGDDFDSALSMWGPDNGKPDYIPTRIAQSSSHPGRRGWNDSVAGGFPASTIVDPKWTGYRDSNRGVALGINTVRSASSVLTVQARAAKASELPHLRNPAVNTCVDAIVSSIALYQYYPAGANKHIFECRMRLLPGLSGSPPRGGNAAVWTYSSEPPPAGLGSKFEIDINEAYATKQTSNRHTWLAGSTTDVNTEVSFNNALYDGQFHLFTCIEDGSSFKIYVDGTLIRTFSENANAPDLLKHFMFQMYALGHDQGGVTYTQADWDASGTTDTSGQYMEIDYWRGWVSTSYYAPLVTVPDLNVSYNGTGSYTFPSQTSIWGATGLTEVLQAVAIEPIEPGAPEDTNYPSTGALPAAFTWNAGTRTLSVDYSADTGAAGRTYVQLVVKTAGGACKPLALNVNRAPEVSAPLYLPYVPGTASEIDLYPYFNGGVLTPFVSAVSGLPSGVTYDATNHKIVVGSGAAAGSSAITITLTNNAGQPATQNVTLVGEIEFLDTFTATNGTLLTAHASDSGQAWVANTSFPSSVWTLNTNRAYSNTVSTTALHIMNTVRAQPNYAVEADFFQLSGNSNVGLIARASATANTYYALRENGGNLELLRIVAGVSTTLSTTSLGGNNNRTLRLELRDSGANTLLSIYLDGVKVTTVTDTTPIAGPGYVGLRSGSVMTTTTGVHVDRIRAYGIR